MCSEHWHRVPLALRVLVENTWHRWESSKGELHAERVTRLREYRNVQQAAIASLEEQTT